MSNLRIATPTDFQCILTLERAAFGATDGQFSTRQLRDLLHNPRAHWLLGADGDAMVCWLKVSNGRKRWARLYSLAVHPRLRGQGWGERLIKAGFGWMIKNRLNICRAEVHQNNLAARRLYARLGFDEIAVLHDYYGPRQHGLRLLKILTPRSVKT